MTERISLKETYDNRDVIAWLVQQKAQIDDILTRIEGIETIPDNVGSDLRPIRRDNGQFVAVSKNLVQADQTQIGTDTKPVKIFNGEAIPINYDLVSTVGDQEINGYLRLKRDVVVPNVTTSTLLRQWLCTVKRDEDTWMDLGHVQFRRYGNRTRMRIGILKFMETPNQDVAGIIFDVYDSGRIVLLVSNYANQAFTDHTILDSTP